MNTRDLLEKIELPFKPHPPIWVLQLHPLTLCAINSFEQSSKLSVRITASGELLISIVSTLASCHLMKEDEQQEDAECADVVSFPGVWERDQRGCRS